MRCFALARGRAPGAVPPERDEERSAASPQMAICSSRSSCVERGRARGADVVGIARRVDAVRDGDGDEVWGSEGDGGVMGVRVGDVGDAGGGGGGSGEDGEGEVGICEREREDRGI